VRKFSILFLRPFQQFKTSHSYLYWVIHWENCSTASCIFWWSSLFLSTLSVDILYFCFC